MEDRNFKWLLNELRNRKFRFSLLPLAICSGDQVVDTFSRENLREDLKIKYFLMNLLESRAPVLKEYAPDKAICVVHFQKQIRVLTTSAIIQLSPAKIQTMKIRSIHIIPPEGCASIVRVLFNGKMRIKRIHGQKDAEKSLPVFQKCNELLRRLLKFINFITGKIIDITVFDVLFDLEMKAYLVKTYKLALKVPDITRKTISKMTNLRRNEENNGKKPIFQTTKVIKSSINANNLNNSCEFVEMIARTIDRERKIEKTGTSPIYDEGKLMGTIDDLIEEVECTRSKVWYRDIINKKNTFIKLVPHTIPFRVERSFEMIRHRSPLLAYKMEKYKADAENRHQRKQANSSMRSRILSPALLSPKSQCD